MSWLLAAFMPVMLMLWTVGLQRLETVMHGDRPIAAQLVARLEQTARAAREKAAERTINQLSGPQPRNGGYPVLADEPGLPTRPNPLVRPSHVANRV